MCLNDKSLFCACMDFFTALLKIQTVDSKDIHVEHQIKRATLLAPGLMKPEHEFIVIAPIKTHKLLCNFIEVILYVTTCLVSGDVEPV